MYNNNVHVYMRFIYDLLKANKTSIWPIFIILGQAMK